MGPLVAVLRSIETGKAHFGGLCTCASVWACPVCSAIIRSRRAEEVRKAVEAHGVDRTMMLSLTVRHGLGHELKTVRKGVAGSYRRFTRGAPWKRFCHERGLTGFIRGLDLTHGPENGWHPHIHALLLFDAPLSERQLQEACRWIAKRWADCVARELGEDHRPDLEHGTDLRPCHNAEYLAKLGLELTSPGRSKRGKGDQRTPMQIAYDLADRQDPRDAELWRDYCDAMFRAKMLMSTATITITVPVPELCGRCVAARGTLFALNHEARFAMKSTLQPHKATPSGPFCASKAAISSSRNDERSASGTGRKKVPNELASMNSTTACPLA